MTDRDWQEVVDRAKEIIGSEFDNPGVVLAALNWQAQRIEDLTPKPEPESEVERVAIGLRAAWLKGHAAPERYSWDGLPEDNRSGYRTQARYAIAMRDEAVQDFAERYAIVLEENARPNSACRVRDFAAREREATP